MAKKKYLRKKQFAVIEDVFSGELDEQGILDKHKISKKLYDKWIGDEQFDEYFARRIALTHRQSEIIIARYASLAAAKLVQLTESEKEETARKACLDIISLPLAIVNKYQQAIEPTSVDSPQNQQLTPEVCSKLLAVLAEEKAKVNENKQS